MAIAELRSVAISAKVLMDTYQFVRIGAICMPDEQTFSMNIVRKDVLDWEKAIYIFVFNDEIIRVGSSKAKLGKRMKQWSGDVTNALRQIKGLPAKRTATPDWEATAWAKLISKHGEGDIYAREATEVETPVGKFRAYMDEESILINRHKPPLNRHSNR